MTANQMRSLALLAIAASLPLAGGFPTESGPAMPTSSSSAAPLRVWLIGKSKEEHQVKASFTSLAGELRERHGVMAAVKIELNIDFPALTDADVVVIYCRQTDPGEESLQRLKKWQAAGKPVIAIRPSVRAFNGWPRFCRDVLGCDYKEHPEAREIKVTPSAGQAVHPVIRGLKPWTSRAEHGMLYHFANPAPGLTVLLNGEAGGKSQPVAWVRMPDKTCPGRVFYTSLGLPEDFKEPVYRRLLIHAIFGPPIAPVLLCLNHHKCCDPKFYEMIRIFCVYFARPGYA